VFGSFIQVCKRRCHRHQIWNSSPKLIQRNLCREINRVRIFRHEKSYRNAILSPPSPRSFGRIAKRNEKQFRYKTTEVKLKESKLLTKQPITFEESLGQTWKNMIYIWFIWYHIIYMGSKINRTSRKWPENVF